jgi:hypothetical protein
MTSPLPPVLPSVFAPGAASVPKDLRREEAHSDDAEDEDVEGEDEDEDLVLSEFQSSLVLDRGEIGTTPQHRGPTNLRDRKWRCASLHFLQLTPWAQSHHHHRATELRALAQELRV